MVIWYYTHLEKHKNKIKLRMRWIHRTHLNENPSHTAQ